MFELFDSKVKIVDFHDDVINKIDIHIELGLSTTTRSNEIKYLNAMRNAFINDVNKIKNFNLELFYKDSKDGYKYCYYLENAQINFKKERRIGLRAKCLTSDYRDLVGKLIVMNLDFSDVIMQIIKLVFIQNKQITSQDIDVPRINYEEYNLKTRIELKYILKLLVDDFSNHRYVDLYNIENISMKKLIVGYMDYNIFNRLLKVVKKDSLNSIEFSCIRKEEYSLDRIINYFSHLPKLNELGFNYTTLKDIEINTFSSLSYLTKLSLIGNQIEIIQEGLFNGLENLIFLNLSRNKIQKVNEKSFYCLSKLELIDLSNNLIEHMDTDIFNFNKNLKVLNLNNNLISNFEFLNSLSELKCLNVCGKDMKLLFQDESFFKSKLIYFSYTFMISSKIKPRIFENRQRTRRKNRKKCRRRRTSSIESFFDFFDSKILNFKNL